MLNEFDVVKREVEIYTMYTDLM